MAIPPASEAKTLPGDGRKAARGLVLANLGLLLMVLLWGTFFPLLERLLETWDVYSITAARHGTAVCVLLAVLALRDGRFPLRRGLPWSRLFLLGVCGMTATALLTTLGVYFSSGVSAAIASATNPISAAITARLLYALPLAPGLVVGTALSTAGGLLSIFGGAAGPAEFRGGEILIVLSNVIWTWYSMAAQRWLRGHSQLAITALTAAPGVLSLFVVVALAGGLGLAELRVDLSLPSLLMLLYVGALPIAMGNFLWHFGVSRIGVTVASMYGNLIPVAAVLVTVWIGTYPTALQLLGGAAILAGVLYCQIRAVRAARRAGREDADRPPRTSPRAAEGAGGR